MDSFEKKVRALYQQQKREDEKSIPAFDIFRDKLEQQKTVRQSYFLLKVAASVIVVVASGAFYFFNNRKPVIETGKVYPATATQALPSQSLMDKSSGPIYIWNWEAPTDRLLKDATKTVQTKL